MSYDNSLEDYEFEYYEKYYGGVKEVKNKMENCPKCGSKLFITHNSDRRSLLTKEIARCSDCDYGQRKILHTLV